MMSQSANLSRLSGCKLFIGGRIVFIYTAHSRSPTRYYWNRALNQFISSPGLAMLYPPPFIPFVLWSTWSFLNEELFYDYAWEEVAIAKRILTGKSATLCVKEIFLRISPNYSTRSSSLTEKPKRSHLPIFQLLLFMLKLHQDLMLLENFLGKRTF